MSQQILFSKHWEMPSANTYSISPIAELLDREIEGFSIDPFARASELCTINNDINPAYGDLQHDALEFLRCFKDEEVDTVLFDPPYSPRQVSDCYKAVGVKVNNLMTSAKFWKDLKDEITRITHKGSKVISFGWNSGGIGKTRGFVQEEIMLVAHGGAHYDTIVTIERKATKDKITTPVRHTYLPFRGQCPDCGVKL